MHRILKLAAIQVLIFIIVAVGIDWLLVKFDLLRPSFRYGDHDLGFTSSQLYRTSEQLGIAPRFTPSSGITIAMVGDSHSDLSLDNPLLSHEFILEADLRKQGMPAVMISAGQGMYSPLQEYQLYKFRLRERFSPQIVLMNFYIGNDFYDILRPDDRPHYIYRTDGSIGIQKPEWFAYADPDGGTWREQSRLLWVFDDSLRRLGYPKVIKRIGQLSATARTLDGNFVDVIRYLVDLNRSVEPGLKYSGAFAAQMLNQALFFHYFPEGKDRSLAFIKHLMATARKENPGVLFVMSPIPSAALAQAMPADVAPLWINSLENVNLTDEFVRRVEYELYQDLHRIANESGWLFIDLLSEFQGEGRKQELYNSDDIHINEAGSKLIGQAQARKLFEALENTGTNAND